MASKWVKSISKHNSVSKTAVVEWNAKVPAMQNILRKSKPRKLRICVALPRTLHDQCAGAGDHTKLNGPINGLIAKYRHTYIRIFAAPDILPSLCNFQHICR